MKNNITLTLSGVLLAVGFFVFVMIGAASHGHIGLYDHADSFELYMIIYYCLTVTAGLNYLNYQTKSNAGRSYGAFNLILCGILLIVGLFILITTINQSEVDYRNYLTIAIPIAFLIHWIRKLMKRKSGYER